MSRLFRNAHHHGSWPSQLAVVWSLPLTAGSGGPTSISCAASHLLASVRSWHTVVRVSLEWNVRMGSRHPPIERIIEEEIPGRSDSAGGSGHSGHGLQSPTSAAAPPESGRVLLNHKRFIRFNKFADRNLAIPPFCPVKRDHLCHSKTARNLSQGLTDTKFCVMVDQIPCLLFPVLFRHLRHIGPAEG